MPKKPIPSPPATPATTFVPPAHYTAQDHLDRAVVRCLTGSKWRRGRDEATLRQMVRDTAGCEIIVEKTTFGDVYARLLDGAGTT